jgi:chromosome segregation ATPase
VLNLETQVKMQQEGLVLASRKPTSSISSPRSESVISVRSSATDERNLIDQLQSRIDALEYDNERLRSVGNTLGVNHDDSPTVAQLDGLEQERDEAVRRISQLEGELKDSEHTLGAQRTHISSLEEDYQRVLIELEALKLSSDSRLQAQQKKIDGSAVLVMSLQGDIDKHAAVAQQKDTLCKAKDAEIAALELKIQKTSIELQEEKSELGAQIEELRLAGQASLTYWWERAIA